MKIIADVTNQTITFSEKDVTDKNIYFGFTDHDGLPVFFDNVSFGYVISKDSVAVVESTFPENGVVYEATDQEFITSERFDEVKLGTDYEVFAWVENAGVRWENNSLWNIPRWNQPYPSWSWDYEKEGWFSPVSYPTDGKVYEWNEQDQRWDEVNV